MEDLLVETFPGVDRWINRIPEEVAREFGAGRSFKP